MSNLKYTGVLAILLASTAALAGEDMVEMERPSLYTSNTAVVTSVVEAINHETREVTLKGEDGELVVPFQPYLHRPFFGNESAAPDRQY